MATVVTIARFDVEDAIHTAVLDALDDTARRLLGVDGWKDQDLPQLFKALDAQIEAIAEREGIALLDSVPAKT